MSNCLITKLKENVNKDNLPKLGVLKFTIPASDSTQNVIAITPPSGKTITVKVIGATFIDGSTEISSNAWFNPQVSPHNEVATVEIKSKYDLVDTQFFSDYVLDLNQFEYTNIIRLSFESASNDNWQVTGNLSKIIKSSVNIERLSLRKSLVNGNLDELATKVSLLEVTLSECDIRGNIASLDTLINLSSLNLAYSGDNYIVGSLESLLSGLYHNGKQNGELFVDMRFCHTVTFNNTLITELGESYNVEFNSSGISVKNWNRSITFATYNGLTWTYNI